MAGIARGSSVQEVACGILTRHKQLLAEFVSLDYKLCELYWESGICQIFKHVAARIRDKGTREVVHEGIFVSSSSTRQNGTWRQSISMCNMELRFKEVT